ncbi:hypothetical protein BKA64DRAFT_646753 [Cadophora sp. MPI-SDFR-AT-0126]|nr:hypothetical protein BKA64DRAFT_646753 [Leotiomycetes sp. MPI-SDFR-AT-0126]
MHARRKYCKMNENNLISAKLACARAGAMMPWCPAAVVRRCNQTLLKRQGVQAMQASKPAESHVLRGSYLPRQVSSILVPLNVLSFILCSTASTVLLFGRPLSARSQGQNNSDNSATNRSGPYQESVAPPRTTGETPHHSKPTAQHSTDKTWGISKDMGKAHLTQSQDSRNCHPANPGLPFTVWTLMPLFPMDYGTQYYLYFWCSEECGGGLYHLFRAILSTARVMKLIMGHGKNSYSESR